MWFISDFALLIGRRYYFPLLIHLILCFCMASSCTIKNIEYRRSENFQIEKLSSSPELSMDIVFYNPNKVGCKLSEANVVLISGKDTVGVAHSKEKLKLKSRSEFSVPCLSRISLPILLKLSGNVLFNNKQVPVDISGEVTIRKFLFKRKVQFSVHDKIDSKFFSK